MIVTNLYDFRHMITLFVKVLSQSRFVNFVRNCLATSTIPSIPLREVYVYIAFRMMGLKLIFVFALERQSVLRLKRGFWGFNECG